MPRFKFLFVTLITLASALALAETPDQVPAEAFAQLPDMADPELSPDGKAIAFLRPIKGKQFLFIQELGDASTMRTISSGDELEFRWLNWASNERLVFALDFFTKRYFTETTETRLMSVARDGTDVQHIIKTSEEEMLGSRLKTVKMEPPQIQDNVISWLPDEPWYILVSVDGDRNGMNEVRKVNIKNGEYSLAAGNTTGIQYWRADQDGIVRFGWGSRIADFYTVYRDQDGKFQSGNRHKWLEDEWYPISFDKDPQTVFVSGSSNSEPFAIRKLDVSDGTFSETVFADANYSAGAMMVDRYERPTGVRYVDHHVKTKYFDPELDRLQRSADKALPGSVNQLVSMSDNRDKILVYSASDTDPGVYLLWNRDNKTIDPVGERMPGIDPEQMSPTKPVSYAALDGETIPAYLTIPVGEDGKNLPTIVMPHGGPASRSDSSFWFLAQFLASRGYAVLQPNFRGSSGYSKAFKEAGEREWGGLMQDDVTAGAEWLVEQGIADPERMCIVGWSYGGYSAAMGAIKTPKLFSCAASINGVLNLVRLASDDKDYVGGNYWIKKIGLAGERLRSVSPYHHADKIEIPMLIVQARDDSRVHLDQATGIAEKLKKDGKKVELVIVDKGGHSIDDPKSRLKILQALEEFLSENI